MFSDSNIQRERKREREREGGTRSRRKDARKQKKKTERRGRTVRVFIGLLCQGYSSAGRKPNWYCRHLSSRDLLSKALAAAYIFPRIHSQDFLPHLSPFFLYSSLFMSCRVTPENMTLFRKRLRAAFFIRAIINSARERRTRRKV